MNARDFRARVKEVYPKAANGDREAVEALAELKRLKDRICACGCGLVVPVYKGVSPRRKKQRYVDAFHHQNHRRTSTLTPAPSTVKNKDFTPRIRIGGMKLMADMITPREERLMKQLVAMCSAAEILISNTSRTALERFDVNAIKQARDVLVDEVLAARLLLKEQLRESSHRSDVRYLRKKVVDGSG